MDKEKMIDQTTSQELLSNVVPYLVAGGIKGLAGTLWTKLKSILTKKEDIDAAAALEKDPNDKNIRDKLSLSLESELSKNKSLEVEIKNLLKELQASETHQNFIKQIGNNNIAVAGQISNSSININQK